VKVHQSIKFVIGLVSSHEIHYNNSQCSQHVTVSHVPSGTHCVLQWNFNPYRTNVENRVSS